LSRESHLELQPMASSLGLEAPQPLSGLWRSIQPSLTDPDHYRTTPMGQILGNPKENLEDRARRLLPRLAMAADLKTVESDQRPCAIGSGLWAALSLPSTVLHIHPRTGDVRDLKERLQKMAIPIVASDDSAIAQSGSLAIVLRTILPEEDILLANQLRGTGHQDPSHQVDVDL
jgi:seryl-tRNA(Sec) selenium transferase